jgi:hypothetical protein
VRVTANANDLRMDAVVDPRVRTGIQIGVQAVRKASGRRLTGCEGGDSFFGSSDDRTGLSRNPKPLFSGSFLAKNVCWGAQRGISLASERFFWESTPVGIHPLKQK